MLRRLEQQMKCTPMRVHTNQFLITPRTHRLIITQYEVDIKLSSAMNCFLDSDHPQKCPKKYFKPAVAAFGRKYWPKRFPAYDGSKILFSFGDKLIDETTNDIIEVENEERLDKEGRPETITLEITVTEIRSFTLDDLDEPFYSDPSVLDPAAIQAFDIALKNSGCRGMVQIDRNFFYPPDEPVNLGKGMQLWNGVFKSTSFGVKNVFLNVDVVHKGFPKAQLVRDLIIDLATQESRFYGHYKPSPPLFIPEKNYVYGNDDRLDNKLRTFLKGLKVVFELPGANNLRRIYRVKDIAPDPLNLCYSFQRHRISVWEYYRNEIGYDIQNPYWPCLLVEENMRNIYLPIELCRVAQSQVTTRKLDIDQFKKLTKCTVTGPSMRKANIMSAFDTLKLASEPVLNECGLVIDSEMTLVQGKVLVPPALRYGRNDRPVSVRDGAWKIPNEPFQNAAQPIRQWAIVDLCEMRSEAVYDIAIKLNQGGMNLGLNFIARPKIIHSRRLRNTSEVENFLEEKLRNGVFNLVVVIIPDYVGGASPYSAVKQVVELKYKILAQCIRYRTAVNFNQTIAQNVLLKINAKLDGKNHSLHSDSRPACFDDNVMIMGADVTHPPRESKTTPSVAAVTASHDSQDLFKYNMQWRLQTPRTEMISDMQDITLNHLQFFAKQNGAFPDRIIFYRDGVSDGQFDMVLNCELEAIRKAIEQIGGNCNPKITLLVVQKRHHTRFFPQEDEYLTGKNGNVPAGFVVNETITRPTHKEFFLVSHETTRGTAKPTKYKVLHDDANMSDVELQQLTFYLCHLYARCNSSVSYPAPTYYAHLAAARAKHFFNERLPTVTERFLTEKNDDLRKELEDFTHAHPMFFI